MRSSTARQRDTSETALLTPVEISPGGADSANDRPSSAVFRKNSAFSVARLLVSSGVALVLPGYLARRLPISTYSVWVLILQVCAYVNYLDFGIQTGIAKYVAEYEAKHDLECAGVHASAGLVLMLIASSIGILLSLTFAWVAPGFFHQMAASLYPQVRIGIIAIGSSLSFGLFCSIFAAVFFGLQRYAIPTILNMTNRILFAAVLVIAVALNRSLAFMGLFVAGVNVLIGVLHFSAWRKFAWKVRLSLSHVNRSVIQKMVGYCSSLAVWTVGMLFVTGLDVIIVGKYDFSQTAYYSVAALPGNFLASILGAALAPLMPAASALSVSLHPAELGSLLARATRYTSVVLFLFGASLLVCGSVICRIWLGAGYATHMIWYLRLLVLGNLLRNLCLPYSTMLVATNRQRVAIAGIVSEAAVNLVSSLYLVRHIGAIGVAYGTLIGAVIGVAAQFLVNMHYTQSVLSISRLRLLSSGILRPAIICIPSLLLLPYWWSSAVPGFGPAIWPLWIGTTILLAWFIALTAEERELALCFARKNLNIVSSFG